MSRLLEDLAQGALRGLGQLGEKALERALDSALEDVEGVAEEVNRRVKRARKRIEERTRKPPKGEDGQE